MTSRNAEIALAEDNNQQLLVLLEKYDKKLDELREADDMKEINILRLQKQLGNDDIGFETISRESFHEKIDFLQGMIDRLKKMSMDKTLELDSRDADYGDKPRSLCSTFQEVDAGFVDGCKVYREKRKTSPLSSVLSSIQNKMGKPITLPITIVQSSN